MRVLHIVGGLKSSGAFKGAHILHKALKKQDVNSVILNDHPDNKLEEDNKEIKHINEKIYEKIINKFFILTEKIIKSIFLSSPRSTFTLGFLGFDITKIAEYQLADIIHIHWLSEGFVDFRTLLKSKKPIVWTMRDMWPFTGGSHYTMDFEKYEKSLISKKIKEIKKRTYKKNFKFVAMSEWLKLQAEKSDVLLGHKIDKIYNNIVINNFKFVNKDEARNSLNIKTNKKIILFGAQNPQSTRKGWDILLRTLKKIDKSKYFLLLFGRFWSQNYLDEINIEYKSLGFIDEQEKLNLAYHAADLFYFGSLQEAFGKTCAEALACQLPVLCFKDTSVEEFVEHKINGYIVDQINPKKIEDGIEWISSCINKKNY